MELQLEELLEPAEIKALLAVSQTSLEGTQEPDAFDLSPFPPGGGRVGDGGGQATFDAALHPHPRPLPPQGGGEKKGVEPDVSGEHARPYELPVFDEAPTARGEAAETQIAIQIELGRAVLPAEESAGLRNGSVVFLDKVAADPVDILASGRLIARGEVLVLNDRLCVRIAEMLGKPTLD